MKILKKFYHIENLKKFDSIKIKKKEREEKKKRSKRKKEEREKLRRLFCKKADGKDGLCLTKTKTSRVVVLRLG